MDKESKPTRLQRLEQRIAELTHQRQRLLSREKEKERKARTRRLIQIGAIATKYLNCPEQIEPPEFEKLIREILRK
jgi:hypothetical protein